MDAHLELTQILEDTMEWVLDTRMNFDHVYSKWSSQGDLLAQLNEHISDAHEKTADFGKLFMLFAPTAGLCEIVTTDSSIKRYMVLAARFDDWYASVRPV
ncbi:hypothetical protein Q9K02_00470 [Qipengyuania sp. G39]|uniref:Uncharacterized protein n=1 Tax=Qipengyuania profundimaris TaxID=3067652 RepID=A0ABT9HKC7_9SPHN|nr:hypothetical protein [Qipengyuania sp. G39]MDP4573610.1 hypothetical protein [Qipengyuania sp. G39]